VVYIDIDYDEFYWIFQLAAYKKCDWETFEGREEFFEQVRRKGDKLGKMMMYETKQEISEKYLKVPPGWILWTIKRELNASDDDTSEDRQDRHETVLAY
jgi:hypothetical protein